MNLGWLFKDIRLLTFVLWNWRTLWQSNLFYVRKYCTNSKLERFQFSNAKTHPRSTSPCDDHTNHGDMAWKCIFIPNLRSNWSPTRTLKVTWVCYFARQGLEDWTFFAKRYNYNLNQARLCQILSGFLKAAWTFCPPTLLVVKLSQFLVRPMSF